MVLKAKHRSTLTQRLTELVDDEEAVEDLLAQFPVREGDEPISKEFLRAEMGDLRVELANQSASLTRSLVTWMIAVAGIAVTVVTVVIGVAAIYVGAA